MKIYVKSSTDWNELSDSEQIAVEFAYNLFQHAKEMKKAYPNRKSRDSLEDIVRIACQRVSEGNSEPEYEGEDFYTEEPDYNKVLSYFKSEYGEL